ncbi:NACHT domain-containing protein [Mesorhizobium sp. M0909]|uniref:NACHT domain-containing protein n=1 Tax=Mesorhizobium sp. M0909 TaxID=2957024 RepID=UPI00333D0D1F
MWRSAFQDAALVKLLAAYAKQNNERLASISRNINDLLSSSAPANYDEQAITTRIAKASQAANRDIAVETNRGRKRFPIDKVFVKSRLTKQLPAHQEDLFAGLNSQGNDITHAEFIATFKKAVVLGDPGGGKSTLCQSICFDLSKAHGLAAKHSNRTDLQIQIAKVPLRVILREFEKWHERDGIGIFDFMVRDTSQRSGDDVRSLSYWLKTQLSIGQVVVVFDGIDEILDVASRRKYVQMIEEFCRSWESASVVCTSRIVGYSKAPLSDEFEVLQLSQFTRDEVKRYTRSLISLIENKSLDSSEAQAEQFIIQTDSNASDLRRNPLMLGLMVWLFVAQGHVPRHKAAIYLECATLMFEKWDRDRGIRADIPDDFNLMQLFSEVASKVFGNVELESGVTSSWLDKTMFDFFSRWYDNNARADNAAKRLREFITGRSWVMTDVGPDRYWFTHRTFLEYFFAKSISDKYDTVKRILYELRAKISAREWDVICHLAVQNICYQNARKSEECVDVVISMQNNKAVGFEKRQNILAFLANTVEYLVLSDSYIRKVFRLLIDAADLNVPYISLRMESPALAAARLRPGNSQLFLEEMSRALDLAVSGKDSTKLARYVGFLLGARRAPRVPEAELDATLGACRLQSRDKLVKAGFEDQLLAKQLLVLYPEMFGVYLEKFGDYLLTDMQFGEIGLHASLLLMAIEGPILSVGPATGSDDMGQKILSMIERRLRENKPFLIKASSLSLPGYQAASVYRTKRRIYAPLRRHLGESKGQFEYYIMATTELAILMMQKRSSHSESDRSPSKRRRSYQMVQQIVRGKTSPLFKEWLDGERSMFQVVG